MGTSQHARSTGLVTCRALALALQARSHPTITYNFASLAHQARCTAPQRLLDIVMAYGSEDVALVRSGMQQVAVHPRVAERSPCFVMAAGIRSAAETFGSGQENHLPLAHVLIKVPNVGREFTGEVEMRCSASACTGICACLHGVGKERWPRLPPMCNAMQTARSSNGALKAAPSGAPMHARLGE